MSAPVHYMPPTRDRITSCSKTLPRDAVAWVYGERATRDMADVTCPLCLRALAAKGDE